MGIINGRSNLTTDPVRNFRYIAQFTPHNEDLKSAVNFKTTVGFTQISGLTMTTESIPYREGGYNTSVHQVPGQSSFSPITFVRGVVLGTPQNWDWMKRMFSVVSGASTSTTTGGQFRCNIDIYVIKHPAVGSASTTVTPGAPDTAFADDKGNAAMQFKVYNAWPTSIAYSDLNAGDNALMVEQMTVVHEGFELSIASSYAGGPAKIS